MNQLNFQIERSPASNDHQVRIWIDGIDWLGASSLGIDPPSFFAQASLESWGECLVGRCDCGCVGCGDVVATVSRRQGVVLWTDINGVKYEFSSTGYDRLIVTSREDFRWEDTERSAERLVSQLLRGVILKDGFTFDWASARVRKQMMTLSFTSDGQQRLLEFEWNGVSVKDAVASATQFHNNLVQNHD